MCEKTWARVAPVLYKTREQGSYRSIIEADLKGAMWNGHRLKSYTYTFFRILSASGYICVFTEASSKDATCWLICLMN